MYTQYIDNMATMIAKKLDLVFDFSEEEKADLRKHILSAIDEFHATETDPIESANRAFAVAEEAILANGE